MAKESLAVGLKKGYLVEKRAPRAKPSHRKGVTTKRVMTVRAVVREVAGYAPYERRTMELLKVGHEKRAMRLVKKRVRILWESLRGYAQFIW